MNALVSLPWFLPLVAATVSGVTLGLLEYGRGRLPHAYPTDRSLHDRPVARVGGLAIWAGFLPVALLAPASIVGGQVWIVAWVAVTLVSIADDWRGVTPAMRLVVHALAALAVAGPMLRHDAAAELTVPAALAIAGAAFTFVWAANLFNFMDGNDGLAATMAVGGFGAYGGAALLAGAPAVVFFGLAAAVLPFLAVNAPPARTFMGDGGSVPLGFLAAVFGLSGIESGTWPPWFPMLVFLPFGADATVTVIRRVIGGKHMFEAHNTHYYQRLHRMGAGHLGTLLTYAAIIALTSTSALYTLAHEPASGWWVLGGWITAFAAFFATLDHHWRKRFPGTQ